MMRDLDFFISEALIGMKRSGLMTFIAIATITVSLIVFGIFLLLSANFNNLANFITNKLEIRVFLKETLTSNEIEQLKKKFAQVEAVKNLTYIPKDQAWSLFKDSYGNIDLEDIVENNPLPNSFRIQLKDNRKIKVVAKYLQSFKYYVDDVQYGDIIAERIQLFSRVTKLAGLFFVALLSIATLLIVVNTIRLTIIARQDEINIMHLVGATKSFIRWPFIIEGLLMGCLGSFVSIIVIKFSYTFLSTQFQKAIPFFPLVFNKTTLNIVFISVVISGAFLGIFGAYISVSKSLRSKI